MAIHWHREFEINYIVSGKGEFLCGDEKLTASKGDILVLPPDMLHGASACTDCKLVYYAFVFSPVLLGENSNDRCTVECIRPLMDGSLRIKLPISMDKQEYEQLVSSIRAINLLAAKNLSKTDLLLKSELLRFFWILESGRDLMERRTNQEKSYGDMVRPAFEYMQEHMEEEITVAQLATAIHLSKSYFMSSFKKAAGIGAMEYLGQIRINKACTKISETNERISSIAVSCGYGNISNFNRQFRKYTGCTPCTYRKQANSVYEHDYK